MREVNLDFKNMDIQRLKDMNAHLRRYVRDQVAKGRRIRKGLENLDVMDGKEIDFEELDKAQKSIEKLQEIDISSTSEEAMEKTKELSEKIKDSAISIDFVKDRGALRAHIFNKITQQLLGIIPPYIKDGMHSEVSQTEAEGVFSNANLLFVLKTGVLSNYADIGVGDNVDREV